jgi:peptidoglycan/LPS O-acetylase OafA/YrhL
MSGEAQSGTARLSEQKVPELDGVRGFALVMVMAYHCLYFETTGPVSSLIDFLRGYGWIALDLFFVLSGYLITGILLDMRGTRNRFRNFYARRALRILPLYYLALLLFFNLLPFAVSGRIADALTAQGADQAYYWLYVQNWLFAWRGNWPVPPDINHLWSLNVEEQFYLVWPLVVYGMGRVSMMRLCVVFMVACLIGRIWLAMQDATWVTIYVSTPTRMDALAVGSWLAGAARSAGGIQRLERFVLPVGLSGLAIVIGLNLWRGIFHPQDVYCQTLGLTVAAFMFGAMIVGVLCGWPRLCRFFSARGLQFLGGYSYAAYVFHFPILVFWNVEFPSFALPTTLAMGFARFAIIFGLSILVALISWQLWEKRFLALKRHFPR